MCACFFVSTTHYRITSNERPPANERHPPPHPPTPYVIADFQIDEAGSKYDNCCILFSDNFSSWGLIFAVKKVRKCIPIIEILRMRKP